MMKANTFSIKLFFAFAFIIFGVGFVGAAGASYINYQSQPDFQTYYSSGEINNYWPILNERDGECKGRQDIILNVAPAGCQPAVVRSDLLEEQNVPVFCQIDALQVNPLLNIKQLKNIRFGGTYPAGVVGTGFHPARAALRTRDTLLGSPILNNIGYVVVVLKKTPNEKDIPDFINVTLSAQIEYESGNAVGIGRTEFKLSPVSDEKWEEEKLKQSFWNGRYFVRLNEVDENFATVSIYDGDKRVSISKLKKGINSGDIYMPGSFCMAALNLFYDGYDVAKNKAVLKISDDISADSVDVYAGSSIYNNRCRVDKIEESNGLGNVTIVCGSEKIFLEKKPLKEKFEVGENVLQDAPFDKPESQKAFEEAIAAYERVADDYPSERRTEVTSSNDFSYYGEAALDSAIILAGQFNQFATQERLLNKMIEFYPSSFKINDYRNMLSAIHSFDASSATKVVNLNGRYVTIQLSSLTKPSSESTVRLASGQQSTILGEGKSSGKFGVYQNVIVDRIRIDGADVTVSCSEENKITTSKESLREGEEKSICGNFLRLDELKIDRVAKIRLLPKASYSGSESNLTVRIGIEKRAIQLSPDRARRAIETLNKTIIKWEKISEQLGKVVTSLKTACFSTSLLLTVKNFISGTDGTALARQQTMSGDNGWKKRCEVAINTGQIDRTGDGTPDGQVTYKTPTECFNRESEHINNEIEARTNAINNVNGRISKIEENGSISQSTFLGGKSVDTNKAVVAYYNVLASKYGADKLKNYGISPPAADGTAPYTYQDLRAVDYNLELDGKYGSAKSLDELGAKLETNKKIIEEANKNSVSWGSQSTVVGAGTTRAQPARGPILTVTPTTIGAKSISPPISLPEGANGAMRVTGVKNSISTNYIVVGTKDGNVLTPTAVYTYTESGNTVALTKVDSYSGVNVGAFGDNYEISTFEGTGSDLDLNQIKDVESKKVSYFSAGPDRGLAYRVPFDLNRGWYVRVESSLNVGNNIPAYDSSGRPKSWRICNVGSDGIINLNDECQLYIEGTGAQKILGLPDARSAQLISQSRQALMEANNQAGNKAVKILGTNLVAGSPVATFAGTECQEFMDIQDCNILFNVCDPVICPTSRCNLGGKYPVADVVQTGIVGSTLLCLPNFGNPTEGGVLIPVCLTGIQAGLDSWVSILKNQRDCLQENVESGKMTGICDEIYSFYMCDLFWKNVGPFANSLLPSLIESAYGGGQGARGGGEYLAVQSAWDNTQNSINYMTQNYASNSFKLFQARSVEEIGGEFCKMYLSAKGPTALKSLIEPDSPSQFSAWFSSDKYSDATVPATAQYKVFYHIFAGKNNGVYYSVYLKNPPESPYYSAASTVLVASGFAKKGEYASQTKDFTAPEGYRELCVRINNEDKCGFKQVSTDYAVNYLSDRYTAGQAQAQEITSERQCVSGSPGFAATNLNPQAALTGSVFPQDYERGIVRICATRNPGESTDPTRYADVGYCENQNTRCWLDKNSVKNAIGDKGLENQTLSIVEQTQKSVLEEKGIVLTDDKAVALLKDLEEETRKIGPSAKTTDVRVQSLLLRISEAESTLFYNHHKANLFWIMAQVMGKIAKDYLTPPPAAAPATSAPTPTPTTPAPTPAPPSTIPSFGKDWTANQGATRDSTPERQILNGKTFQVTSTTFVYTIIKNTALIEGHIIDLMIDGKLIRRHSITAQIGTTSSAAENLRAGNNSIKFVVRSSSGQLVEEVAFTVVVS